MKKWHLEGGKVAFDGLSCFSQKSLWSHRRPLADFWIIAFEHFHYVTTSCHLRKIFLISAKSRRPGPRISCNDTASFFRSLFLQHLKESKTFRCLLYFQNLSMWICGKRQVITIHRRKITLFWKSGIQFNAMICLQLSDALAGFDWSLGRLWLNKLADNFPLSSGRSGCRDEGMKFTQKNMNRIIMYWEGVWVPGQM